MEILYIFLGIIAVVVIVVMVKYYTDPKMRKAVDILNEYHEKEEQGVLRFDEKEGYIENKKHTNDDELLRFIKNNPDDGSDKWLNKASEIILEDDYEDFTNSDDLEDIMLDLTDYSDSNNMLELPIRGINFRGLTDENIGSFDGYIMPDKDNERDKYAIGIYGIDGVHFGFIEKGQKYLYNKIEDTGGSIGVTIDVHTFTSDTGEECFNGTVTIDKEDLL